MSKSIESTMPESIIVCRTLRELDALVAEKLMGWKWYLYTDYAPPRFS